MWILIFMLSRSVDASPIAIEFSSEVKCEEAGKLLVEKIGSIINAPRYVCAPK